MTERDDAGELSWVEGDGFVALSSGERVQVDEWALRDADGNVYGIEADLSQEIPGLPHVSTVALVPLEVVRHSEAELEQILVDSDPTADLVAFRDRRARNAVVPVPPTSVQPSLLDWASTAAADDTREVRILLRRDDGIAWPRTTSSLDGLDPAAVTDLSSQRQSVLAARRTTVPSWQAPLISRIQASGGRVLQEFWLVNMLDASVSPALLRQLELDPDVLRIEDVPIYEVDTNDGAEIRHAVQLSQFWDQGYDGSLPSGRNPAASAMLVGVIDNVIDDDHPGWQGRFHGGFWLQWNGSTFDLAYPATDESVTAANVDQHGSIVTSVLAADYRTAVLVPPLTPAERAARTGMAPGVELLFWETGAPPVAGSDALQDAIGYDLDVLNYSMSCSSCTWCDVDHADMQFVDALMLSGVFVVNTPGNLEQQAPPDDEVCTVAPPGTASGSFTPTAANRAAVPLSSGGLRAQSAPYGGDVHGRAIIDLAAPDGFQGSSYSKWDQTFGTTGFGTSLAAPVIAGAAALVKHRNIAYWGSGAAINTDVGHLYAQMLLMGDGQLMGGAFASSQFTQEMDPMWGAGRLRTRMWGVEGMDAPHRMRTGSLTLADGNTAVILPNPDASGVNQPLPADVDVLKVALWWHEPNLGSAEDPAEIVSKVVSAPVPPLNLSQVFAQTDDIQAQHLIHDNSVGGQTLEITVTGLNIPASTDPSYFYGQSQRKVYWALYWEDQLRDDVNGPDCCAEIDIDYTTCCANPGASCPSPCP